MLRATRAAAELVAACSAPEQYQFFNVCPTAEQSACLVVC